MVECVLRPPAAGLIELMDRPTEKKRVFLVDDHPLVREWLTRLLNQQPDFRYAVRRSGRRRRCGGLRKDVPTWRSSISAWRAAPVLSC